MQASTCRRLVAAAIVVAATASAPAHAGIWETVETPTNQTITGIEYRADGALWMTTSSSIFKRSGGAWSEFNRPGTNFNAIAFNPAGTVGLAAGDAGAFYRFSGGAWTQQPSLMTRNYPGTYCPSSPTGSYTLSSPIVSDLTHVRWIDNSTVYIFSERYGSLMRSLNGGQTWTEINRQADGTCRIDQQVNDVFVLPSNANHMLFLGGSSGYVFLSTNGLTSTAAYRGSGCGTRLSVDPSDPARMYTGGPGCYRFAYGEDGGVNLVAPTVMNGDYSSSFAFDAYGSTVIGAGNAGYVFNSIDPDEAYLQPVDGRWATNDWRAADLASASAGAIGGTNGALIVSDKLNTIPDIVKPTGKIAGPTTAVAGQTVTFTADVTDAQSGVDPNGFAWTKDSTAAGGGQTVGIAFPQSGWYTIRVSYRDRAGNTATANTDIRVSDPPSDNTDPTGTITGPAFAVAGQSATFTANVTDSGSGVDLASLTWSRDFSGAGRGNSVTMTFPAPGTDTVSVSFSDLAGNRNSASVTVPVAPKPEDRPKPVTVNTPAPVVKSKGGRYVIPIKGGYRLPNNVKANLGCTGDIVFTMKKAKRLLSARTTKLNTACKYNKSFSVAKSKVGSTKKVGITVRFSGNAWLAPVKKTYQVKVPKG